jgi:hypothetical protein
MLTGAGLRIQLEMGYLKGGMRKNVPLPQFAAAAGASGKRKPTSLERRFARCSPDQYCP